MIGLNYHLDKIDKHLQSKNHSGIQVSRLEWYVHGLRYTGWYRYDVTYARPRPLRNAHITRQGTSRSISRLNLVTLMQSG